MHKEEYEGRHILVYTVKRKKNWTWSYQIDGGTPRENRDRLLPNEEIALEEALGHAKAEIDAMG